MALQRHEVDALVDLVKSFPEVTVLSAKFEGEALLPGIVTAGKWPMELKLKIKEQFPEVFEQWGRCPIYPDEASADAEIERQRINQEPLRAVLCLSRDPDDSEDTEQSLALAESQT
jgi:hypothetical protein